MLGGQVYNWFNFQIYMKKNITHWVGVIIIGIALGLALQFVRAWTEPTEAPPGGNVGAPINTSDIRQTKNGGLILNWTGTPASIGLSMFGKGIADDFCTLSGKCLSQYATYAP